MNFNPWIFIFHFHIASWKVLYVVLLYLKPFLPLTLRNLERKTSGVSLYFCYIGFDFIHLLKNSFSEKRNKKTKERKTSHRIWETWKRLLNISCNETKHETINKRDKNAFHMLTLSEILFSTFYVNLSSQVFGWRY